MLELCATVIYYPSASIARV